MSTLEMFKFWLIKEMMPLFIGLGILAGFALVLIVWATIEFYAGEFKRWKKNRKNRRSSNG